MTIVADKPHTAFTYKNTEVFAYSVNLFYQQDKFASCLNTVYYPDWSITF